MRTGWWMALLVAAACKRDSTHPIGDFVARLEAVETRAALAALHSSAEARRYLKRRWLVEGKLADALCSNFESTLKGAGFPERLRVSVRETHVEEDSRATIVADVEGDDYWMRARWYAARRDNAWRLYDFEELQMRIRILDRLRLLVDAADSGELDGLAGFSGVRTARAFMDADKLDQARELLVTLGKRTLSVEHEWDRVFALVEIAMARGEYEEALELGDRAEKLRPGVPIVAYHCAEAHYRLDRSWKALPHVEAYNTAVGPTFEGHRLEAWILEDVGRTDSALTAYRKALAEDPTVHALIAEIVTAVPLARKGELLDWFADRPFADWFGTAAGALAEDDDWKGLASLVAAARQRGHDTVRMLLWDARALARTGRHREALEQFRKVLKRNAVPDDRSQAAAGIAHVHADLGEPITGYDAAPPDQRRAVFRLVADHLVWREEYEALKQLIARHRKTGDGEPEASVFEVVVAHSTGDAAAVVRIWDARRASFADEYDLDFWHYIVIALLEAGRAADALAAAEQAQRLLEDSLLPLVVHARMRHAKGAWDAFRACLEEGWTVSELYAMPRLAPLRDAPEFAELRKWYRPR